ncbi:hypothetical protein GUJ93_ZPchr0013g37741 [Zizania palustris]|uniref:Dof zinc finger protein n=1 Tax=Zizania palustris TaxID=103762 RepID=A0A8J5X1V7_ZIZPA|nr:hypothetical protein GUJ93_ZPchr0013g37741 [Zizania palustris]
MAGAAADVAGGGGGAAAAAAAAAGRSGGGGSVVDPRAEALRCPRCDSANTKFCYYNNYSLSQPRHFCKACKRYWTRGGTLRNVPVGGGCRKNKRSRSGGAPAGGVGRSGSGGGGVGVGAAGVSSTAGRGAAAGTSPALPQPGSLPSLSSALGLTGGTSLASLLLGSGSGGDHLGLFQAMQSVVSDAAAFEMHQQQTQVDHLLGLGYGAGAGSQIQTKPWLHVGADSGTGLLDGFYAPLLSSSIAPGLEELQVKAEATGEQHQKTTLAAGAGEQSWDLPTPSSSNVEASIIASDALMAAAASMNPAVTTATSTAPSAQSLLYWGNGGLGAASSAWSDITNYGSSIATLF